MTPADMAALHARCFPDRPWDEAEFSQLLDQSNIVAVTAPFGFVLANLIAPEAEILTVAVAPDQRRKGIALGLFRTLWSKIEQREITTVFLEVAADNTPALKLYDSLNFQEVGCRKAYYARQGAPAQDALVLRCELT